MNLLEYFGNAWRARWKAARITLRGDLHVSILHHLTKASPKRNRTCAELRRVETEPDASLFQGIKSKGIQFERFPGMTQDGLATWLAPRGAKVCWFKDPDG